MCSTVTVRLVSVGEDGLALLEAVMDLAFIVRTDREAT
jgi:hypothetical protein